MILGPDRSTQFTSADHQQFLTDQRITSSMSAVRHLCPNLFEQEPSKLRMSQKRRKAA